MSRSGRSRGRGIGGGYGNAGRARVAGFMAGIGGTSVRQRVLTRSELKILMLSLLNEMPAHGYELIRSVKKLSYGGYAPSTGAVYPALNELENQGLVEPTGEAEGRKIFAITLSGEAEIRQAASEVQALKTRLTQLLAGEEAQPVPIERALVNLQLVLEGVVPGASKEDIHKVVSIIDDASQRIERI